MKTDKYGVAKTLNAVNTVRGAKNPFVEFAHGKRANHSWSYYEHDGGHKEVDYINTYSCSAYCPNCNYATAIRVKRGVSKPELVECPNCGCLTLTP